MAGRNSLRRVVHVEFDWVWGVLEVDHFLHLEVHVGVNEIVIEHSTGLQESGALPNRSRRVGLKSL